MAPSTPSPDTVHRTFDHLGPPGTPFTTREIAAEFDCSDRTIFNRLDDLVDRGIIETKKVGAKGRVWWKPVRADHLRTPKDGPITNRKEENIERATLFLSEGEMAERIQEFEWGQTPLGPIATWSIQLRVAVDIMLGASEAIGIYWGGDLRLLYNDAAIEQIGDKHPEALGQPARDVFPEAWDDLEPIHNRVMAGEGPIRNEEYYLPLEREGELEDIWWDSSFNPIPAGDGSVGGVFNISFEVTHRVRAERELRERTEETERRYKGLFESINVGFCVVDVIFEEDELVDYRVVEANETLETLAGPADPEGRPVTEMELELEQYWSERYGEVAHTGESMRFQEYVEDSGRWWDVFTFPIGDEGSNEVGIIYEDVTERKRREQRDQFLVALTETLQPLSDPEEIQHEAASVLGEHLDVDRAHYAEVGEDEDTFWIHADYYRGDVSSVVGEHSLTAYGESVANTLQAGQNLVINDSKSAPELDEEDRAAFAAVNTDANIAVPLVKAGRLVAIFSIDTVRPREWTDTEINMVEETAERTWAAVERARADQELRDTNKELALALEAGGMGTWEWDLDSRTVECNQRLLDMFNLSNGNGLIPIDAFLDRMDEASADELESVMNTTFEPGEEIQGEICLEDVPQAPRWLNWRARSSEDNPSILIGVSFDITERKQAQKRLEQERDMFADGPAVVFRWKPDTEAGWPVEYVSGNVEDVLGYSPEEFLSGEVMYVDILLEEERDRIVREVTNYSRALAERFTHEPYRVRTKDGDVRWVDDTTKIVRNDNGEIENYLGYLVDITEQKTRENRLDFINELNESLRPIADPETIAGEACRLLGEQLDADHVYFVELDEANDRTVVPQDYVQGDLPSRAGEYSLSEFRWTLPLSKQRDPVTVTDVMQMEHLPEEVREASAVAHVAWIAVPIVMDGELKGSLCVADTESREWLDIEIALVEETAERTWAAIERARSDEKLRQSEAQLEAEVETRRQLHQVSTRSIQDDEPDELYDTILDTVVNLLDADFGSLQLLDDDSNNLILLSNHGFPSAAADVWDQIGVNSSRSCARALQTGERILIPDLEESALVRDSKDFEMYRRSDIRAVQITPLILRNGEIIGMLSTHWREPHEPSDDDLHLVDVIARQAADLIQHQQNVATLTQTNHSLERLSTASAALIEADVEEIARRAPGIARDVLDVEYASLWEYDENIGELREVAKNSSPSTDRTEYRLPDNFSQTVWQTFVGDDITIQYDGEVSYDEHESSLLRSRILAPLGRHGVIAIGSAIPEPFDDWRLDLLKLFTASVESAWNRAESERALEDRNEELTRLDSLNTLIRRIDQGLVDADTVDEIDEMICQHLSDSTLFEFAWIGEYDAETDNVLPRTWAGLNSGTLEDLTTVTDNSRAGPSPFEDAVRTAESQIVADIATDVRAASWREAALRLGARSCVVIPITCNDTNYGVLIVYGPHPQPNERDLDVLAEFGRTIGNAIHAVETRRTVRLDSVVELTLQATADTPLVRLARELDCELSVEGMVPESENRMTLFFSVADIDPDDVISITKKALAFKELTPFGQLDGRYQFRAKVIDEPLLLTFLEAGASIQSLSIDAGMVTAVVTVSETPDVREFIERITQTVPNVELLARRSRQRSFDTPEKLQTEFEQRLTPRQQEILQFAYLSGYFETPRTQTGQELSKALDLSQSTFNHHLRGAERHIFDVVFADALN